MLGRLLVKRFSSILIALIFISSFYSTVLLGGSGRSELRCETKYPVMLVHGFLFRDKTFGINYWGNIPRKLNKEMKHPVLYGEQNGWDSMKEGAYDLYKRIDRFFALNPKIKKINLICHSQGAIEIRYMIAHYGNEDVYGRKLKNRVASITSMCSPHRGTKFVSFLKEALLDNFNPTLRNLTEKLLTLVSIIEGDIDSSVFGPLDMHPSAMEQINKDIKDKLGYDDLKDNKGIKGIFCQSWAGGLKTPISADPPINIGYLIQKFYGDKDNDGIVPGYSTPFGLHKGKARVPRWNLIGLGHQAMVDRELMGLFPGSTPGFDITEFYLDMVEDLKNRGL